MSNGASSVPTVTSGATEPIGKITILKRRILGVSFGGASRNDTVALTAGASIHPKEPGETRHFGVELVPGIPGCIAPDGNGLLSPGRMAAKRCPEDKAASFQVRKATPSKGNRRS